MIIRYRICLPNVGRDPDEDDAAEDDDDIVSDVNLWRKNPAVVGYAESRIIEPFKERSAVWKLKELRVHREASGGMIAAEGIVLEIAEQKPR